MDWQSFTVSGQSIGPIFKGQEVQEEEDKDPRISAGNMSQTCIFSIHIWILFRLTVVPQVTNTVSVFTQTSRPWGTDTAKRVLPC
jgi:hypothetical protein